VLLQRKPRVMVSQMLLLQRGHLSLILRLDTRFQSKTLGPCVRFFLCKNMTGSGNEYYMIHSLSAVIRIPGDVVAKLGQLFSPQAYHDLAAGDHCYLVTCTANFTDTVGFDIVG
jgi:hypothetical protein